MRYSRAIPFALWLIFAAALTLLVLGITSCSIGGDPPAQWETICHEAGKHNSKPYSLRWKHHEALAYEWRMDESAKYAHGDEDQYDWNKLTGLAWSLTDSHQNTAMVGWRYVDGDSIQLNAYFHVDGSTEFTGALTAIRIGDTFTTAITVHGDGWVMVDANGEAQRKFFGECCNNDRSREVWPWFGGNNPAPHAICYDRRAIPGGQ